MDKIKFKQVAPLRALVIGALAVMAQANFAHAEDATGTQKLEKIEVTGSSIKRIEAEGALPVQRISKEEIAASGATNTADLLQKLASVQGFTASNNSIGGNGAGFAGVSLHNVGETRTLVLLNGRRLASYGGQSITGGLAAIDLNTIPLANIDHVEVLTDGASALYGSDAVGGVVNFVTKRNSTDGEVAISATRPKQTGGQSYDVAISKGFGDLNKDGYNVLVGATTDHQASLGASQRSFSKTGNILFPYNGQTVQFFNGSPRSIPANILVPSAADPNATLSNYYSAVTSPGNCPPNHVSYFGTCYFDYVSQLQIYPEQTRNSFSASGTMKFGDHTAFADVIYATSRTHTLLAPPPGEIPLPTTSPFYNQYAVPQGATGDTIGFYRVFDAGGREDIYYSKSLHMVVGLEGNYADWDYTTSLTHSTNDYTSSNYGGYVTTAGLNAALSSGLVNPFLLPGQQSQAGLAAINAAKINGFYDGGRSTLDSAVLRGSREVFTLPGGPVSLGAGINFNREKFSSSASQIAQGIGNTRFGDTGAEIPYSASRSSTGVFAELLTPVMKELEVTTSVRNDHYSDFGNTTNFKLGLRYQPTTSLLLRGSAGTGFKAPTVPQVDATKQQSGVTSGSFNCPFTPAQITAQFGPGVVCPAGKIQYQVFAQGNKNLKPEKSNQWTMGFRWEPTKDLSVAADIWNISIRDSIGQVDEAVIFGAPSRYSGNFTTYTDPGTGQVQVALAQPNVNLGKETNEGIDIDLKTRNQTPLGRLTSQVLATYMIKHDYELLPGGGYYSDLGQFVNSTVTFRWQVKFANTLDVGKWKHTLTANFKSGYADQGYSVSDCAVNTLAGDCIPAYREVASYITWDAQSHWQIDKAFSVTAGILNLFDQDPPLTIRSSGGGQPLGFDGRYTNPLGRAYYLRGSYAF